MLLSENNDNKVLQKGFTLIEIIVSIAILGIIAVAFLPLISSSISGIFRPGQRAEALFQAQSKLENPPAGNIPAVTTINVTANAPLTSYTFTGKIRKVTEPVNGSTTPVTLYVFEP